MKTYHYYLRDKQNRPLVTVCLGVADDGSKYRGISICSPKDNPNKRKGRTIAVGRMLKAIHRNQESGRVFRDEAIGVLSSVGNLHLEYGMKSSNEPNLMPLELKILKGAKPCDSLKA